MARKQMKGPTAGPQAGNKTMRGPPAGREALPASRIELVLINSSIAKVSSVRYRYSRYRYGSRTELTEVSSEGVDVVPNLPKCPVPVLVYRTYRSIRYRYLCRTERTELTGTGMDGVPKCPVPVLMSYRYRCRHTLGCIHRQYRP